jgi:ABC-type branched-subunit amino acid transport system substrate-binding protein
MIANTAASSAFLKKLRAAGSNAQLYCVSVTDAEQLIKAVGEDVARGFVLAQVVPNPTRAYIPIVKEFRADMEKYGPAGSKPSYTALEGYIYAKVLIEGLTRAGANPTRDNLIQALASIHSWDMGGFTVDFGPRKRDGSSYVELTVIGKGGKVLQ